MCVGVYAFVVYVCVFLHTHLQGDARKMTSVSLWMGQNLEYRSQHSLCLSSQHVGYYSKHGPALGLGNMKLNKKTQDKNPCLLGTHD